MQSIAVRRAVREWEAEVDAKMVRLIEEGVPPIDAAAQARDTVSRRRAAKKVGTDIDGLRDLAKAMAAAGY